MDAIVLMFVDVGKISIGTASLGAAAAVIRHAIVTGDIWVP